MKPVAQDHPSLAGATFSHYPALPPAVKVPLTTLSERPCPYLPGRLARDRAFLVDVMPPHAYHAFMDRGFRRSGHVVYQPVCRGCRACMPIRVRVADFSPGRSLRRCLARNADLTVEIGPLEPTDEKFALYHLYQQVRHGDEKLEWGAFVDFLYSSPVETREFTYRDPDGTLLAVGICDVSAPSLSSVYFYYDPRQPRRGLGTFGVLTEIDACRRVGVPYYYLGFWVRDCPMLSYKANFRPAEVLGGDGVWRDLVPHVQEGGRILP